MDLPITKPSMICYADELEFPELLNDLSSKRHNGFIRVTYGSDEGFILFKDGKEIAASYEGKTRVNAVENIKIAMSKNETVIEVFDIRSSQIEFFMDMNRPYIINSEAQDLIDELKGINVPVPEPRAIPKPKPVPEVLTETVHVSDTKATPVSEYTPKPIEKLPTESAVIDTPEIMDETINLPEVSEPSQLQQPSTDNSTNTVENLVNVTEKEIEPIDTPANKLPSEAKTIPIEPEESDDEPNLVEPDLEPVNTDVSKPDLTEKVEGSATEMDRNELMKKYGIKDIQEEEVENILDSYKGGEISDENVEKIELTLMNKIKKSILGIPKIKGAEVMVFLDNGDDLSGKVNIIMESESKGFFSRIIRESKDKNLERQIINIVQIEIRKSFRKFPEIVDKFDVNIEIN